MKLLSLTKNPAELFNGVGKLTGAAAFY